MDLQAFGDLRAPEGREALAAAMRSDLSESGLLATATRLRGQHPPELVQAALTQARLRRRARAKFGLDADVMYFTHAGLEQSTRAGVAAYRARRFADVLGTKGTVLDLGCGIGADLIARARAGCPGEGVERDPLTAEVARANLAALGLDGLASVRVGDALAQDPAGYAAVFADPGRRTARGRVFDPRSYEPPLDAVLALARQAPAACVKVAPGIPHEAIWDAVEAEWISVGGEVKEAALWLGDLAGPASARRRATLIPRDGAGGKITTLTPEEGLGEPPVGGWGRYLYEPDGAVIRAGLVAEVAARVGGWLADPRIAYITSGTLVPTPFAAAYEIEDVLPFSVKRLRAELRRRRPGSLTIKKRGSAIDIDRLRHDLGFGRRAADRDGGELTLVLTRVGDDPIALLTSRAP
ncbi:methyltransferase [Actinomadura sp. NBRC 104412]|uniref:class I SAM-dependent methyltransferase n=1 Tax=Actinomadura sp. NBRC 104412 TaxID=3032203 RepID=UPI0024A2B780|nr:SAM-dependent methyltransferase [Actinomadura sp. NBRC 104412]GLZ04074.1 methyltransferase [Actinomadura sp. NBRC 104412]